MINPYKVRAFAPAITRSAAVMLAYENEPFMRRAAAQALFGGIAVKGRLPVDLAGIAAKLVSGNISWVLAVYVVNLGCLALNWAVYFRNRRLDARRASECAPAAHAATSRLTV